MIFMPKIFAAALAFLAFIALIVVNTIGWAFYSLINSNAAAFFESFGVEDPNIQLIAVIAGGAVILAILVAIGVKKKGILIDALT